MESTPDAVEIAQMPAATPPPGVTPNLVDPYSNGPVAIAICSILIFMMLVFVSIRLYVKLKIVQKLTPDDCKYSVYLYRFPANYDRYLHYCDGTFPLIL